MKHFASKLKIFLFICCIFFASKNIFSQNNTTPDLFGPEMAIDNPVNASLNGAAYSTPPNEISPQNNSYNAPNNAQNVANNSNSLAPQPDVLPQNEAQQATSTAKLIRLEFRSAPLSEVLRAIANEAKINIVFAPIIGNIPVDLLLYDVPWDMALKTILETNKLGMVHTGNVIRVTTIDDLDKEKDLELKSRQKKNLLTPVKLLVMRLSYAKADQVKTLIGTLLQKNTATGGSVGGIDAFELDGREKIEADLRSNSIIAQGTPNFLSKIKALIERVDLRTPQVKIATRIVEILNNNKEILGLGWRGLFRQDAGVGAQFGNLVFPNSMVTNFAVDPGSTFSRPNPSTMDFNFGSINGILNLDLRLSMEQQRGNTELLYSNNVIVQDQGSAKLTSGNEDIILVSQTSATGQVTTTAQSIKYNMDVKVNNVQVTADGFVQMDLELSAESPANSANISNAAAAKSTRAISTKLMRRSGDTIVIGGAYNQLASTIKQGVPFLSSLPIIGPLFRRTEDNNNRREILLMVTPTILSAETSISQTNDPKTNSNMIDGSVSNISVPSNISNAPTNNSAIDNTPPNNAAVNSNNQEALPNAAPVNNLNTQNNTENLNVNNAALNSNNTAPANGNAAPVGNNAVPANNNEFTNANSNLSEATSNSSLGNNINNSVQPLNSSNVNAQNDKMNNNFSNNGGG